MVISVNDECFDRLQTPGVDIDVRVRGFDGLTVCVPVSGFQRNSGTKSQSLAKNSHIDHYCRAWGLWFVQVERKAHKKETVSSLSVHAISVVMLTKLLTVS